MFFTRYNIDPTAEIGDYDINKLMTNLEGPTAAVPATQGNYIYRCPGFIVTN